MHLLWIYVELALSESPFEGVAGTFALYLVYEFHSTSRTASSHFDNL